MINEIIAVDYLCFFALLEMVLCDKGYNNWSQIDLANYFGVTLPENYTINGVYKYITSNDVKKYGYCIDVDEVNCFFDKNNISMKLSFESSNPYGFYTSIDGDKGKDEYHIYAFSYGSLYLEPQNIMVGHVALHLNRNGNDVEIYDPGPRNAGRKLVSESRLYDAMYDNRGGIFTIKFE